MPPRRVRHDELDDMIELTRDPDPRTRAHALRELCPCHVKANHERVWERIFEMAGDPDVKVRRTVMHALADGSPRALEPGVVNAIERLRDDDDEKLRTTARRVLDHYRRTGTVNIL